MISKGKTKPKLIAWLICAAMVFTTIPFSMMGYAQAAEDAPVEVNVTKTDPSSGEIAFFIHGVENAEETEGDNSNYKIAVKGVRSETPVNVYVSGEITTTTGDNVVYSQSESSAGAGTISIKKEWANNQSSWIAIALGVDAEPSDAEKNEIKEGIKNSAQRNLEYNGKQQDLMSSYSQEGWTIAYSLEENGTFDSAVPKGTNAQEYTVYFKATKDGYAAYIDNIKVSIAKQTIEDGLSFGEATQEIIYDIANPGDKLQEAMKSDKHSDFDSATITYRVKKESTNTAGVEVTDPEAGTFTYTAPGEATIEACVVSEDGNKEATAEYKLVVEPIEVNDLEFENTPDVTFNKENAFQYKAASENTPAVKVKYTITDAGETEAEIDESTGKITYNAPGTIKVKAEPVSPYAGKEVTYEVKVKYADVGNILLSSNGTENVKKEQGKNKKWFGNGSFTISRAEGDKVIAKPAGGASVLDTAKDETAVWSEGSLTIEGKTDIDSEYMVAFQDKDGNLTNWINVNGDNNKDAENKNDWEFATDKYAPSVSFSHNKGDGGESVNMEAIEKALTETEYGYFFKKAVEVTITSNDTPAQGPTGVEGGKIAYRLVNADGTSDGDGWIEKNVDDHNRIKVKIEKGFKGQIEAYAVDELKNTVGKDNAKHPNGIVWEDTSKHIETSSIQFGATEPKGDKKQVKKFSGYGYTPDSLDPVSFDTDGNGAISENGYVNFAGKDADVQLYSSEDDSVSFDICVKDMYSGIAQVRWTVLETEAEKNAQVEFDNTLNVNTPGVITSENSEVKDGQDIPADLLQGSFKDEWEVKRDRNLVTKLILEDFEVSGNSNDMVLLVEMTDNSGNKSYDYYGFGIDNEKPVVEVKYDPAVGDRDNAQYFKENRTATIKVYDRNFDPKDEDSATLTVTRDKKTYDTGKLEWKEIDKKTGDDENGYETTVTFKEDGDYTFDMKVRDRAGNENDTVVYDEGDRGTTEFTIDKTNPTVSVQYDNNSAANGKYFNRVRTATMTVREHNFDVNRVTFDISAALDGTDISQPGISWSHNGDVHTATIAYRADGDYRFGVTVEDMAGNKNNGVSYASGTVAGGEFTIDTRISEPTITGVSNGQSYKDTVIPVINLDDVNYDTHNIVLLRTRKNEQNMNVTSKYIGGLARDSHGGTITCNTFEKKQDNDGIYRLTVSMTDKAGNRSEKSVTFTVNRFGSVYDYNTYLSSLQDQYVKAVTRNVVITEYNPDRLVEGSLKLEITKDGTPLKDPEYSVAPVINRSAPIGSSGWYQYEYDIDASNFEKDGVYRITVASEDEVGNKPETSNYEELDAMFRVDSVAPEFTSIEGLEDAVVNAEKHKVSFNVFDAIGLDNVTVYVDDKKVKTIDKFEDLSNCSDDFVVNSGLKQDVRFVAEDKAGNTMDTASEKFQPAYEFNDKITVSTNIFVRWFANTWLFVGSLVALAAIAGGIIAYVRKRRNAEEIEDEI